MMGSTQCKRRQTLQYTAHTFVQMVATAHALEAAGFHFWDFGQVRTVAPLRMSGACHAMAMSRMVVRD